MLENEMETFAGELIGVGEIYGKQISEQMMEIYWRILKQYELEDVLSAIGRHVRNTDVGNFFPKPSDIIRSIEGSGETKALLAWTKTENALKQIGSYESIVFDDELIHSVLEDMGGWVHLCSMTYEDLPYRANEFKKRYMGYVNNKPTRYPKICAGRYEIENSKNGFDIAPPVLVGDSEKAKRVFLGGGGEKLKITQATAIATQKITNSTNFLSETANEN